MAPCVCSPALCLAQQYLLYQPRCSVGAELCCLYKQCLLGRQGNKEKGKSNVRMVVPALKMVDSSAFSMGRHVFWRSSSVFLLQVAEASYKGR